MGRNLFDRLFPVKIILIFNCTFFFSRNNLCLYSAFCCKKLPDFSPGFLVFINSFSNNIPRSLKSILNSFNTLFLINEFLRFFNWINVLLFEYKFCQRFKSFFFCNCGSGTTFWSERKIDVLQRQHRSRNHYFPFKFICE